MAIRVVIDKQSCQSSGRCIEQEPAGFAWDDDDLGDVRPGAAELPRERLFAVARGCPALAVTLYDEDDREIEIE